MNTPPNNHNAEPRGLGSSRTSSIGINSAQRKLLLESKFPRVSHSPVVADPSGALINQVGHKFNGSYADLPAAKLSELMKSTSLDNAPTQSLLSVVNGILEESVERRNGEIPHRVACLLRKVVQEIERRISTQQDHLRTQKNLFKAREEKFQSRIKILETLASGTKEESQIALTSQIQQVIKAENIKNEEKKKDESIQTEKTKEVENKANDKEVIRLMKELLDKSEELSTLKQELETLKKTYEVQYSDNDKEVVRLTKEIEEKNTKISTLSNELETTKKPNDGKYSQNDEEVVRLTKEMEEKKIEISALKQELETVKKTYEGQYSQNDKEAGTLMKELENKNMEISTLKQELETAKKTYEAQHSQNDESVRLMKELEKKNTEFSTLKQELETTKKTYEALMEELENKNTEFSTLKQELETTKKLYEAQYSQTDDESVRLMKELEKKNTEFSTLKQELDTTKKTYESQSSKSDKEVARLMKELEIKNTEMSTLNHELETTKKTHEAQYSQTDKETVRLMKELENKNTEISTLKQELESTKETHEAQSSQSEKEAARLMKELENKKAEISTLNQELESMKETYEEQKSQSEKEAAILMEELENKNTEISTLNQELESTINTYEGKCSHLEAEAKDTKGELKQKSQEYEHKLEKLRNKVKETEASAEATLQKWKMKVNIVQKAMSFQGSSIQKIKLSWESIKQDVMKEQMMYAEECNRFGVSLKPLVLAAENYQLVLAENRKMFNELQEIKGNIRVFCRIRPFLPGQKEKQSIVESIVDTDLVVANPAKQGKEALKTFKFNKIFGPLSTQAEVYAEIQAFIRSVLDGYNACIFAYGQTGSGKTYTMSGPNGATAESLGVNYRALNDLFSIASTRQSTIVYDIGVQIIEIYNEQVRDLLTSDSATKKLGISTNSQASGLAVPDASMFPVKATGDVIKLMDIGFKNRAKGATSMNERSSRSHSVVSIHVRGVDQKSGSTLQGNLHLVDLAGSERVDRSEVTGDRLKEAQHINKSLSALGDVIFALAQKSSHIPYRNSKLTQLLQSSLGGHAKTLMLVQINSDVKSYSESLSTLKFAERVSGVELGAARSTKDGRDVKELMEQVASLKNTILTKDDEIERLQLLKDLKNVHPTVNSEMLQD